MSRLDRQDGSLPMALIVSIIVAGVIVALFTVVQSGQRSSARNRDVAQSIYSADAGIQESLVVFSDIAALLDAEGDEQALRDAAEQALRDAGLLTDIGQIGVERHGESSTGTYTWQARRSSARLWEVRSVGTFRSHTSVVETSVGYLSAFEDALYHDNPGIDGYLQMNAGNFVMDSDDGSVPSVGSASTLESNPLVSAFEDEDVDLTFYGPDATDNCIDSVGVGGTCPASQLPDIPPYKDANFAREAYGPGGDCENRTDGVLDGLDIISATGSVTTYYDPDGEGFLKHGQTYCFESVTFRAYPGNSETSYRLGGDPDDGPATIHIAADGNLVAQGFGNNTALINWDPSDGEPVFEAAVPLETRASDLLINLYGGIVDIKDANNARMAAGIFAPHSVCITGTQMWLYGALICDQVRGQGFGGARITYDTSLEVISLERQFAVRTWSQESCGTTGFGWQGPACPSGGAQATP